MSVRSHVLLERHSKLDIWHYLLLRAAASVNLTDGRLLADYR